MKKVYLIATIVFALLAMSQTAYGACTCDAGCDGTTISLPFTQNGSGEYCWQTTDNLSTINSWNLNKLEINDRDYTNAWSNSFPAKIDGKYYIYYRSSVSWGHFEATGGGTTTTTAATTTTTAAGTTTTTAAGTTTTTASGSKVGMSTWFEAMGSPYGGCGVPQDLIEADRFVALNVFNSPGIYEQFPRPITGSDLQYLGEFNNGLNCGRWVKVTIEENCDGINDGAPGQPFCRGGTGWLCDGYCGATLYMIVSDSCGDGNAWCRDSQYHLDLAKGSLNEFEQNGTPVGDMYPDHYNNRRISWDYVEAPSYSGDIRIFFMQGAQYYWPAILITHLRNGIHAVEQNVNGSWVQAEGNSDMGQSFILQAVDPPYQIRVLDASDQLINNGRVYVFDFPAACGEQCSQPATEVSYSITTTTTAATTTTTAATTTTTAATTTTTTAATTTTTSATTTTTAATTTTTAAASCTCDSGCDGTAITPNFSQNGSGQYCWQATSGTYINSWNTTKVEVNNTDYTNTYVFTSSFPAKINGVWYIYYNSSVAWGHFELNN